jgi:hypothetical protein
MFGTASVISLASFSLEQDIFRLGRQSGIQNNKVHCTSKCTIMYIMYFTINLLLHVSAQFQSSGSYTSVVKTYNNTSVTTIIHVKGTGFSYNIKYLKLYYINEVLCR